MDGQVDGRTRTEYLVGGRVGGQAGAESLAAGRVDDQHEANGLAGDRKPCWNQGDQEAPPWPGSQRRSQRMRLGLQHQLWLGLLGQRRLGLQD